MLAGIILAVVLIAFVIGLFSVESKLRAVGRVRSVGLMCIGSGLTFAICYAPFAFLRPSMSVVDFVKTLAFSVLIVAPFAALLIAVIAVPTALLYEKFAPANLRNDLRWTILFGAFTAVAFSLIMGIGANAMADPDNPFALRIPFPEVALAAGLSGGAGAFIWWRRMEKSHRD